MRLNREAASAGVDQCDTDEVLAQHWITRGNLLCDSERTNRAVCGSDNFCSEAIRSACAQPLRRPVAERDAAPLFKGGEEIGERGVGEGVSLEVEAQAGGEAWATEARAKLLQDCAPLPVGDPVKVEEGLIGIEHRPRDRMRGRRVILSERPRLQLDIELAPGVWILRPFSQAEIGDVGSERFVEPEVVPPAHRHKVAEPHVGDLVEDDLGKVGDVTRRWRTAEDVALGVGDEPHVLHGANIELRTEDVIHLVERILTAEDFAEIDKGLLRHLLESIVLQVLRK